MIIQKQDNGGYFLIPENNEDKNLIDFLMTSSEEEKSRFSEYEEKYKNDVVAFAEDIWFAECNDFFKCLPEPATLCNYQKELLAQFASGVPCVVTSKRQCGMSELLMCFALWKAAFTPDAHVLLLVPSIQMVKLMNERMDKSCFRLFNEDYKTPIKETFEFPNGSTIKININSRGYSANTLIIDDFLFFKEDYPTDFNDGAIFSAIGRQIILASGLPKKACSAIWESANEEKSVFTKLVIENESNGNEKFIIKKSPH